MTSPSSLPYLPASLCGTACLCLVTIALLSLVIVVLSSIFSALAPVLSITVSLQRHKKQIFLWGSNKKEKKKSHTPHRARRFVCRKKNQNSKLQWVAYVYIIYLSSPMGDVQPSRCLSHIKHPAEWVSVWTQNTYGGACSAITGVLLFVEEVF